MKKFVQKLIHPFYKRYHFWYHRKPRKYAFGNVYTIVQPGVFSPKNTISTKVFLDYISTLDLKNKSVLELGCGSGIIAIQSAFQGAQVTASDIHPKAVISVQEVAQKQGFKINAVLSDLLEDIPATDFDYIFINPPYYPRKAHNLEEKAWFCGENFEYFEKMMSQVSALNTSKTKVLMILSDACDFHSISQIAKKNTLQITEIHQVQLTFEKNLIYRIHS